MGGAIEPFFVTNSAGGMQQPQPQQPVSDQRMQDQAVAMAIALADSQPQTKPEKTDSDAALALHLALNDSTERITFRGDPSGKGQASPPLRVLHVTSLSNVCNTSSTTLHIMVNAATVGTTFAVDEELWRAASGLWSSARQARLFCHVCPLGGGSTLCISHQCLS